MTGPADNGWLVPLAIAVAVWLAVGVAGAWKACEDAHDVYRHPCAEDEYVQVDGKCVHLDVLRGER